MVEVLVVEMAEATAHRKVSEDFPEDSMGGQLAQMMELEGQPEQRRKEEARKRLRVSPNQLISAMWFVQCSRESTL